MEGNSLELFSEEHVTASAVLEEAIRSKHTDVSSTETPEHHVQQRPDGFDYVEEGYMRNLLNQNYPIWSWEVIKYEFIGDHSVVVHGRLTVFDNGTSRHYDSIASHKIHKNKKTGEYTDLTNSVKGANSDAFKVATNRLCNICDDIYRKGYDLSAEKKNELLELLDHITDGDMQIAIREGLENGKINASTFKKTRRWVERQIDIYKGEAND
jgi:hypothetical protein